MFGTAKSIAMKTVLPWLLATIFGVVLVQGAAIPDGTGVQAEESSTTLSRRDLPHLDGFENQQHHVQTIKNGFSDMRQMVNTGLDAYDNDPELWLDVLGQYFDLGDGSMDKGNEVSVGVHNVLSSLINTPPPGKSDGYGSLVLGSITLFADDFKNLDDTVPSYSVNEENTRMHIGPSGYDLPLLGNKPQDMCEGQGPIGSEEMAVFATLLISELTKTTQFASTLNREFPQCTTAVNGQEDEPMDVCDTDTYVWLVTDLFWAHICGRNFEDPDTELFKRSGRYNINDWDSDEDEELNPTIPQANLFAAATYIQSLLRENNAIWAMMGGFDLICRGSPRATRDIDVVTNLKMGDLRAILEPQPLLILPNFRSMDGAIKIFVKTGPSYGDCTCDEDRNIEVDIFVAGNNGAPRNFADHRQKVEISLQSNTEEYYILDLLNTLRTKLHAFFNTLREKDGEDILFLVTKYPREISALRTKLDAGHIDDLFESEFFEDLPASQQVKLRRALRS